MIMKKRVLKRAAALLLAGVMLCGLAGCDKSETSSAESGSISSTLTVSDSVDLYNPQSEFDFIRLNINHSV